MSTTTSSKDQPKGIVRYLRKIHNAVGFSKGYNYALWIVLGGGLLGFACARFSYINFDGVFCLKDDNAARKPKVDRKCSNISSSQMVNELAAKPIDSKDVKMTLIHPQMELGSSETSLLLNCQKAETRPRLPHVAAA